MYWTGQDARAAKYSHKVQILERRLRKNDVPLSVNPITHLQRTLKKGDSHHNKQAYDRMDIFSCGH